VSQQRIKGQETSLIVTTDGELEAEITDIKSCEFAPQFEIKEEGYLGEKTNRFDDIYNGVKGSMEFHIHSGDVFNLMNAIKERAQRITPDRVFNIAGIFSFPNGETKSLTVPDIKFGPMPISVSDRGDYTAVKWEFAAEDYRVDDV
jgi:hypothetical protein